MKDKILDAWIMVENLSEGDINLKDRSLKSFCRWNEIDFYNTFLQEINEQKVSKKGGVGIYFEVFGFEKVIGVLKEHFKIKDSYEDIKIGDKFSIAVYFDRDLNIKLDKTFVTTSYYILKQGKLPDQKLFSIFEDGIKIKIGQLFCFSEDKDLSVQFNSAISLLLDEYGFNVDNLRYKVLDNIENEASELHSFFIDDLEKAKKISHKNLNDYLDGKIKERINLDSKKDSAQYNPNLFQHILQPKQFPLARFPSNPKYSLSLMQQIAVNIAANYNEPIFSVNGPPGTGKTTLLKDIFSHYIVKQAFHICQMRDKQIKGCRQNIYNSTEKNNYSIGSLPNSISQYGIMVASSNNGAVKNIVNELPLYENVDPKFSEDIKEADYFTEVSNSNIKVEWVKDENNKFKKVVTKEKKDKEVNWGLFSCEGGKSANMTNIVNIFDVIENYLYNEHNHNPNVYEEFIEKYKDLNKYRDKIHSVYLGIKELECSGKSLEELRIDKEENRNDILKQIEIKNNENKNAEEEEKEIQDILRVLELNKISLFSLLFSRENRNKYKERKLKIAIYQEALLATLENKRKIKDELSKLQNKLKDSEKIIKELTEFSLSIEEEEISALDMSKGYEELQLDNPWFNEKYREKQSLLFISALKVRKEFIYENRNNLKSALFIWKNQEKYLDPSKKHLIAEAWKWINFVIPVISSTFASFSRMCKNLDENTVANLFIDEAGQALPQASVGAIFRSKKVMVVGDPSQIEPVLTLNSSILSLIAKHFDIPDRYLSAKTSTQTLVDAISKYGFYKDKEQEDWIGIPLWVHRRCLCPMFNISNEISYNGNMVQANSELGKIEWFDIGGAANDKYVKEQGEFLKNKIQEMASENPEIIDEIYIISPFKNVAYNLAKILKELDNGIKFTKYENGKPANVGTVHTFQGKEAKIVFFVLGADENSKGAANWAVSSDNPNIMNVAVTRAKKEFYIIGDKKLYASLGSKVINTTIGIIEADKRNKKEKYDEGNDNYF